MKGNLHLPAPRLLPHPSPSPVTLSAQRALLVSTGNIGGGVVSVIEEDTTLHRLL